MHTVLIISQTTEATLNGKKTGSFFFLFLATWKDILHLAHISWILKQNLRAEQKNRKKHKKKTKKHTAIQPYKVTYTDCMCVWNILYMSYITAYLELFFFFCTSMFYSSVSQARDEKSTVKRGKKKGEGGIVPWVNLRKKTTTTINIRKDTVPLRTV